MAKKVYVHFEVRDGSRPPATLTVDVSPQTTVGQLKEKFVEFLAQHLQSNAGFEKNAVLLEDEEGHKLSHVASCTVHDLLAEIDGSRDIFVRTLPAQAQKQSLPAPPKAEPKAAPKVEAKPAAKPTTTTTTKSKGAQAMETSSSSSSPTSTTITINREMLEARKKLEELIEKKQYRLCKPIIDYLIQNNYDKSFALTTLTAIHTESKRYDEAIRSGKAAMAANPLNYESHYFLGKAYFAKGNYEEVIELMNEAMKLWKTTKKGAGAAVKASKDESLYLDLVALLAEAYFADGEHAEAANLLNQVMGNPLCDRHPNILASYASFAFQYRKLEETIVALLKAIALRRQDARISKLLGEALSTKEGFAELLRQFPPNSPEAASVYAYLGTATEEESCFEASIKLYECAMRVQPDNPNLVLNVVHVCEAKRDYDEAQEHLKCFFTKNAQQGFQSPEGGAPLSPCVRMNEALQPRSSSAARRCVIRWVDIPGTSTMPAPATAPTTAAGVRVAQELQKGRNLGQGFVDYVSTDVTSPTTRGETSEVGDDSPSATDAATTTTLTWTPPRAVYTFSTRELNLIGLYATTVKVSFLQGLLSHLPPMVANIEAVRCLSEKPLHETLVRNEVAYYSDILQLLALRTQEPLLFGLPDLSYALNDPLKSSKEFFVSARQRPLYLVGDSHILSAAWSVLTVHGLPRLVLPKLVTGVKMWHLRPESRFYPKDSFFRATASLPSGAEVVFNLGEIDCREGLLMAVERDYYDSLDAAMVATIQIFTKILKDLRKTRKFRIYVHPVAPVLPETRNVVVRFNVHYRDAVRRLNDDNIQWLDFFSDLLDHVPAQGEIASASGLSDAALIEAAGKGELVLRQDLQHDGTHLSPRYLSLLSTALDRIPVPAPEKQAAAATAAQSPAGKGGKAKK